MSQSWHDSCPNDMTMQEALAEEQRELSGTEQCCLPATEEQRGCRGGRELGAGKAPGKPSPDCTPSSSPVLGQASHWAKVCSLGQVG